MAGPNLKIFTNDNFQAEVLESDVPVLVDFTATWCGPCKKVAPIVEALAEEFAGKARIGKLDVDAAQAVALKYNVRSIPTLLVFVNGQKAAEHIGVASRDKLVKMLGLA